MERTNAVRVLRWLLVAGSVAVLFPLVINGLNALGMGHTTLLAFAAAGIAVAGLPVLLRAIDSMLQLVAHDVGTTPYSALAETAARVGAGSLEQALPGLARVLTEGTSARGAVVWLAVRDRLVSAAVYPPGSAASPTSVESLALLLARSDTDHVVPVLDGPDLRAVLAVSKPGRPFTAGDRQLMKDVANGAAMLLRGVALNAELEERVRRADELAAERAASRLRLTQARQVERRRLVGELSGATTDRLAALREEFAEASEALSDREVANDAEFAADQAQSALRRARVKLDELLERFRGIARGVYPAMLRDQGLFSALEEVATDLPRAVRMSGTLSERLSWETESSIYFLAASAMQHLAVRSSGHPLQVFLDHGEGRLTVRIDDPAPPASVAHVRDGLAEDLERVIALGGGMEIMEDPAGGIELRVWMPDELEPTVGRLGSTASSARGLAEAGQTRG